MKKRISTTNLSRRKFIVDSAAAGGGLALGFNPFIIGSAEAAAATEVNAWVVVKPDTTCVIRIARSEMGQGTLTGLAQLVAEELECDWWRVATEHVFPGQNLAPKSIKLKDPKDWKIAGKPLRRLDTADKLNGGKIYSIDVKLPGMLLAAVKACPVHGGKLASYDEAKVANLPGVRRVVKVNDGAVAVVADTWWRAKTALEALP